MNKIKIFIDLIRLNKPIGFMLLFWPCSWGLAYSNSINPNNSLLIYYLFLFFLGSLLMRSAGCIVNDIVDKDFDKKVNRTKERPITAGKISITESIIYVIILCLLAFIVLIQFNFLTIALGMASMTLAFTYPYMKRITYWPQLFLGITFNWGAIMAWTSFNNDISANIIILYLAAIFWTLGYDTIYGVQDMSDDEIIGLKSTSIKFKKNLKLFVGCCYLINIFLLIWIFRDEFGFNFFLIFMLFYIFSLFYQVLIFKKDNSLSCLKAFKINNLSGLFLFLAFIIN